MAPFGLMGAFGCSKKLLLAFRQRQGGADPLEAKLAKKKVSVLDLTQHVAHERGWAKG